MRTIDSRDFVGDLTHDSTLEPAWVLLGAVSAG
jgi:hypothetical protein